MADKQLIGLVGYAGSGKDTAAIGLTEHGWLRVSFAEPLRRMALAINPLIDVFRGSDGVEATYLQDEIDEAGWTQAKAYHETRKFLQNLGTECRNTFGEDCWIDQAREIIEATDRNVVVTDCRFPNEFALIRELGGHLVKIERPDFGPVNGHISESYVRTAKEDALLFNHTTPEDLQETLFLAAQALNAEEPVDL